MTRPALIFDLDGTLSDPSEGILRCVRHVVQSRGCEALPLAELHRRCIGPPLTVVFADILEESADIAEAVRLFRECYGGAGLFENQLYTGMVEALGELRSLAPRMMIATSKPRLFAERIVDHFHIGSYFDAIYGCELNGDRSDKRELVAHLMEVERLDRAAAVLIGDREHDVQAAKANGITSVGVTWGFGSFEELNDAGADRICSSVAELVDWYRASLT